MRRGRPLFPMVVVMVLAVGWSAQLTAAAAPSPAASQDASSSAAAGQAKATDQPDAVGFPTPEKAIREYMAGVADADVGRILQASAIDEMSEESRFDLSTDRLRAFIPHTSLAPAEYPFFADINRARQSDQVLSQVLMFTYGLLSGEPIDGSVIAPVDRAWAETFVSKVDPSRLASLAIEDIRFSDATFENDTRYLGIAATQAGTYGADELTERLVLFSFEGELYDVGFTLLRYGDAWKVAYQSAPLAGTTGIGTARPTTVEEYDQLTSGD